MDAGGRSATPDAPLPTVSGFEDWYRERWPDLVRLLIAIVGDIGEAEDLAGTVIERAFAAWDRIESPTAWSYRVAVHLGQRTNRRRTMGHERALAAWEEIHLEIPDLDPAVWRAVRALPDRQRTAIALRYVLDLTQRQVADAMGIAPGSAAKTLHDARVRLAHVLGKEGDRV